MTTREDLKRYLDARRARFLEAPIQEPVERHISDKIDEILRSIWGDRTPPVPFALLAIGGYGRGTMHPHSDVDLLFFFEDVIEEDVVKTLLHPLWDLPLKVGHQVRHAADFAAFDEGHMESYTAFLDSRFLLGDPKIGDEFSRDILPKFIRRSRDRFLRGLLRMKANRYNEFGQTIFQLEPDLKEAPGGLRDAHWSDWARKGIGENLDDPFSYEIVQFHHCLRNFLHFQSNRNFNVLSYEFQEQIAEKLGYKDSVHGESAETLMRDYFLKANEVARMATHWEEAITGSPNRISIPSDFSEPLDMIKAFAEAHRKKAKLDLPTLNTIRRRLESTDGALSYNPRAGQAILEMMKDRQGIYETLLAMHEVGLLGKVFPEFEEIRCRVIRDFFHKYTVDEHSLIAIRNIEELPPGHRFCNILSELEHPELLFLALLLHDIGKAHRHDERNHVHPSTEGVKLILEKLGLPEEQREKVVAAVKNHLEMSKIILRRDFSDEHVVHQFADIVGNVDDLRMLCLLTYADMKAVNNEVCTPWRQDLLWQLYIETYNRLMLGLGDEQYNQQPDFEIEIEAIAALLPRGTAAQDIRNFLDGFPRQYLRHTPKSQIAEHFLLSRKLATQPVVVNLNYSGTIYELLVMTEDRPFLFSKITGVLSYFGMNIVRGQAFSNRRGAIFDLIAFEDTDRYFKKNPSEVERFSKVLVDVIAGKVQLNDLLRGKLQSVLFKPRKGASTATIHFDDEFSRRGSILEINASDEFGLLYRIATVISSHGCNIETALITTEGHRAIDVFYLTREGHRLTPELEEQVKRDLGAVLLQN